MLIDMHVHPIFYDLICEDAEELEFRGNTFGVFKQGPMSFDEIFAEMAFGGVEKAALLALDVSTSCGGFVVTNEQLAKLVSAHPDKFFGFASVDPHRRDAADVLKHAFDTLGLHGLKLNPSKQRFYPDDKMMEPLYRLCEEYDKPVIFHSGTSWEPDTPAKYSHPLAFEEVFIRHPDLRCCLAHFGWPWVREMVMLMLKYPNVYTDTSVLYLDSPEESMKRLFTVDMGPLWYERSLCKQVMFASNTPRFRAFKLKQALDKVEMRDYARRALYSENAERFLFGGAL
ncbi:hypothetical protein LY28_03077 [Ruminiclostridium sufflavum DSM 19573]|uniref:Amidohydrolase-related domain-containing protein n=2 Tax=Ruminiclostridium TaxID=1508657 RepID=A0A318XJ96_9FIRM|nr:hypothetical protein LY28_03077 [Ruminiclostridium sufflavum DSM 19573]